MSSARKRPKIIVIVGPTASGKTALAVKIAKKFNGEIVSADSRQIYRGMNIGTAKPTRRETAAIPHYLINIKNPDEDYTAAEYKKGAIAAIKKILRKGKLPILVGGTGLYVRAVTDNLDIPAVAANQKLRLWLESEAKKRGLDYLFKKLVELDPEAAYIVDPKNPRRIIRALEIAIKTGKPFSRQRKKGKSLFDILQVGMNIPRGQLKKQINARVDEMVRNGLIDEVRNLIGKYGPNLRTFSAIGYREIIEYLRNEISFKEAVRSIKTNTWHYAKRQMTWFKRDKSIKWLTQKQDVRVLIKHFLNNGRINI